METLAELAREPSKGPRELLARRGLAAPESFRDLRMAQPVEVSHAHDRAVGFGELREPSLECREVLVAHRLAARRAQRRLELHELRQLRGGEARARTAVALARRLPAQVLDQLAQRRLVQPAAEPGLAAV